MIEQILMAAGLLLIGASIVVIVMVIPKLGQVREDWLRAQRQKKALEDAARAADELSIAFTELGAAVTAFAAQLVSAFAGLFAVDAARPLAERAEDLGGVHATGGGDRATKTTTRKDGQ